MARLNKHLGALLIAVFFLHLTYHETEGQRRGVHGSQEMSENEKLSALIETNTYPELKPTNGKRILPGYAFLSSANEDETKKKSGKFWTPGKAAALGALAVGTAGALGYKYLSDKQKAAAALANYRAGYPPSFGASGALLPPGYAGTPGYPGAPYNRLIGGQPMKSGVNMWLILALVGGAALCIGLVTFIIMRMKNKKRRAQNY